MHNAQTQTLKADSEYSKHFYVRFPKNGRKSVPAQKCLSYLTNTPRKKALECEKLNFEHERSKYRRQKMSGANSRSNVHQYGGASDAYDGTSFFRGVDSELALRKRYKELLKIFHPDNKCGDTKTLLLIQTEYESMRSRYHEGS